MDNPTAPAALIGGEQHADEQDQDGHNAITSAIKT